ncbi:MAG: methyl-accepting chemotaxis protein, partial [Rhodomicrobium sp.]
MNGTSSPKQSGANDKGLKELKRIVSALQAGKLDQRASSNDFTGEWAEVFQAVNGFAGTLNGLMGDLNAMSSAHDKGDIDAAIDDGKYAGDFGQMAAGINTMVSGHIAVKKKAMACVAEIAKGNFEAPLEKFPGKKAFINDTIETLRANLKAVIAGMNAMSAAHDKGDIDAAIDAGTFAGDFGRMAEGINTMVSGHIAVKKKAMACIAEFGQGNFDAHLEKFPGKKAFINDTIETLRANLKALIAEMNAMSAAHDKGDIDVMIDAARFAGDFSRVATGINGMVSGHIVVKKKAMACVAEFGKGNFEAQLEKFPGKKAFINDTIEALRVNLQAIVAELNRLIQASRAGQLGERGNAGAHQGDFAGIVNGINGMLDAIIAPLNVSANYVDQISKGAIPAKITDNYNGDFNTIKNNLNTCIDAVNALVTDANRLSAAAVEGKLATRADASKHQGDFRKIVQGVNDTLDAVIGPLNVSANYVEQISRGAIPPKITDNYNGDFNTIKNNLNTCIDAVNALVADANKLSSAAVEGRLATRADASKHQGDFRKIVQGVNDTLDAVITPLNNIKEVIDALGRNDMSVSLKGEYRGDFLALKDAFERALAEVNSALHQVVEAVEQVGQSAEQLRGASQNMASTSEEQSSSVEEVTSSLEET